ncbi:Arc family DNA-binding protein [Methylobacterium sp. Leaf456]|uniref:Arc family DNA-binding protein n=1 Tax=Methylobacterium sp. Leaf456 TaxID=1736382 RepID=UPI0009EBB98F|nr:Arc family DNA-binding protein [Methylobacterium sp. Leaf456]
MAKDQDAPRRPRGRPAKAPERGRRQNYTFRMSDATRDLVISAANSSGRSISEEIEKRVEDSFEQETRDSLTLMLLNGSENLRRLVIQVATLGAFVENLKDKDGTQLGSKDWESHEPTRAGIKAAIEELVDGATRPTREVDGKLAVNRIIEITQGLKTGRMLSDEEALEVSALEADLAVDAVVTRSKAMAAVITGSISVEDIKALGLLKA